MYYGTHTKTTTPPNRSATTPLLQNNLQTHSRKQKQAQPTATKGRMRSSTIDLTSVDIYLCAWNDTFAKCGVEVGTCPYTDV